MRPSNNMRCLLDIPSVRGNIGERICSSDSYLWIVLIAVVMLVLCLFAAFQYKRRMGKTK